MKPVKQSRCYQILNEVLNASTHGIGLGLSIFGFVLLLFKGMKLSPIYIIAYTLYGSTMILLFLSSTLFHSLIFTRAKKVFQVFDHSAIFLLIAGSHTPYCLLGIKGILGTTLLVIIWSLAILGIIYKSATIHKKTKISKLSTILYVGMGWLCIIGIRPLYFSIGKTGVLLLFAGGLSYTFGAIFYSIENVKFMHVLWHFFVMLGSGFMYFSILFTT